MMIVIMMLHGYAVIITKKLVNVSSIQICFFQGLLTLISSSLLILFEENNESYTDIDMWLTIKCLIFSGIPMTLGQLIFRYGEKVNFISTIGSIAIIVGIVFLVRLKDPQK